MFIKILIFLFSLSFIAVAQTPSKMSQVKKHINGVSIGVGLMSGDFFNERFRMQINSDELKPRMAWSSEIIYIRFPLIFNFTGFCTKFKISKYEGFENVPLLHTGVEIGTSLALVHSIRYGFPYIGVGYQYGFIGTGIKWLGKQDSESEYPYTSSKISSPIYKIGISILPLKFINIKLEYTGVIKTNENFDDYSIIGLHFLFRLYKSNKS